MEGEEGGWRVIRTSYMSCEPGKRTFLLDLDRPYVHTK